MDAEKLKALQINPDAKQRPRRSVWIIFLIVSLLTVLCLYYAWPGKNDERRLFAGSTGKNAGAGAREPAVFTNRTPSGKSDDSILTVSGYIVNRERIELSPRFMGLVKWIGVKKGDAVTNGQVVVLLDDAEQRAALREAEGRWANAKVAVTKAELDYARVAKLIADKIETKQAEDDLRLKIDAARANLKETEGQIEMARTHLDWTVIRSTIDGVVLEKLVDAGELVTPQSFGGTRGPSTALVAVADPKDLQVEIELNESDLAKVFLKQRCRVSPEAYGDKVYEGYVAEMAPEANRQKGNLQIKVQIKDPDRFLTPELSAKVDFLGDTPTAGK